MVDQINALVPVLSRTREATFNVFDVMHHGTHEKQLSNVFRWLLRPDETHGFGSLFQRLFIQEVNRRRPGQPLPDADYAVLFECNTSAATEDGRDVADLVLERDDAAIVVENYVTSDGHGHSHPRYERLATADRTRPGAVVLLCQHENSAFLSEGWEAAAVLTYRSLLDRLLSELTARASYRSMYPEPFAFIVQMHRKFAEGQDPMDERAILDFIVAMCESDEAGRYQKADQAAAAREFANDFAAQAEARYVESRAALQAIKTSLLRYCRDRIAPELNARYGPGLVTAVDANYQGIYMWTIILKLRPLDGASPLERRRLMVRFGPTAWDTVARNGAWTSDEAEPDYSRLFVLSDDDKTARQTDITLAEAAQGLPDDDTRLLDALIPLVQAR